VPRIALITEDAYPYRAGEVGAWCDDLLRGLDGLVTAGDPGPADPITFDIVAVTGTAPARTIPLPPNAATVTTVPIWPAGADKPVAGIPGAGSTGRSVDASTRAALLLCRGMFGDTDYHHDMFRTGLRQLAQLAADQPVESAPITGVPLADVLADGWAAAQAEGSRPGARRFTAAEAHAAAGALASALRPLAVAPRADLSHAVDAGLAGLVALAGKWRSSIPYLVSEHALYAADRAVELGRDVPAPTRVTLVRLFAALARVVYAEAALITAAVPGYQRWQVRHGATAERLLVVPMSADPRTYQLLYDDVLATRRPAVRREAVRMPPPAHLVWPPCSPALLPPAA
jgi:hypothetical protein